MSTGLMAGTDEQKLALDLPIFESPLAILAPRVNLLPPEIAEQRQLRKLAVGLAGAILSCACIVALLYFQAASSRGQEQTKLDTATASGAVLQKQIDGLAGAQAAQTNLQATRATLTKATAGELLYSSYLDDLRARVPEGMRFTSIAFTPGGAAASSTGSSSSSSASAGAASTDPGAVASVTFSGKARSSDVIATWLEVLPQIKGFSGVYLTSDATDATGLHAFTVTASLTQDALSHRFANGG